MTAFMLSILFPVQSWTTIAMCPNCGEIHWGAWVPCDKCGFQCTKKSDLMKVCVLFSDHHMSIRTLKNFGKVVTILRPEFPDIDERMWALFQYIAVTYPESGLIKTKEFRLPEPLKTKIPTALKNLKLPVFQMESSRSH